jgi:vancomycin resistance protein YoaR
VVEKKSQHSLWRVIIKHSILFSLSIAVLGVFIISGSYYYVYASEGRVFPGVKISGYEIGGMTEKELRNFIENINNRYAKEGIDIFVDGDSKQKVKMYTVSGGENAIELIKLDSDKISKMAMSVGRSGLGLKRLFEPLIVRLNGVNLVVAPISRDDMLKDELVEALSAYEDNITNATLYKVREDGSAEIIEEKSGKTFDFNEAVRKIKRQVFDLSFQHVVLQRNTFYPTVTKEMVSEILPNLPAILKFGPLSLSYTGSDTTTQKDWVITMREIPSLLWVRATDDGRAVFSLDKDKVSKYLKNVIAPEIEKPATNAKFTMENNKVTEFVGSSNGLSIDYETTYKGLADLFEARNSLILHNTTTDMAPLVVMEVYPDIQIANSNDLGIVEFLGAGSSTFKDSHTRRIQNIAHAVERLNGTLIKPGEEFSATKYAGPFTEENGYLPEAVIKGKTIKDEVGGGMCQIGTTLFRMAMQTGMPITERHNHSLVVSYYADPVNNNPGTDATLYEPILDFKFLNDTGHHMLLLTEIDYKKQLLYFSLWGTKDGRSGSYTRPKVSKWIDPPAEIEYIISDKDANGNPIKKEKCQPSYRGAVASFTYTRVTPQGEKIDKVFDSYYRPLQKICTVPPTTTPATTTLQ